MSGLFRRLAEQASGRANTLHAPARLPFHARPPATEALDAPTSGIVAEMPSPRVGPSARPRPTRTQTSAVTEATGNPPGTTDSARRGATAPASRDDAEAASAFDHRGDDDRHDAPPQDANAAREGLPNRRARASVDSSEIPAPIAPRLSPEAPPRMATSADRETTVEANTADRKAAIRITEAPAKAEFPPTLLPTQPPTRPANAREMADAANPGSRAPGRQVAGTRSDVDAPNEVHVHIGRIEVTALQESAPQARKKKNGRAPMSLDEYIAKRQRGSS